MTDTFTWNGRPPDLHCPECGFRYWTYSTIRDGAPCPNRVPIPGQQLPVRCGAQLRKITH